MQKLTICQQRDVRLMSLPEFKIGPNVRKTVAIVCEAWGACATSDRPVRRLFSKFSGADMDISRKPLEGTDVLC